MNILVTGAAGFIGYHLAKRFLERGDSVLGIDNLNDYYDVQLKEARLGELRKFNNFRFIRMDITDRNAMEKLFSGCHCEDIEQSQGGRSNPLDKPFDRVVHMAAQAGVRYSLTNPHAYVQSNLVGFLNVLEGCRNQLKAQSSKLKAESSKIEASPLSFDLSPLSFHLVYASSSSVYGLNTKMPFSVNDNVDHPISLYGATKKANELMAHTYSYLYGIPTTGLRFFTVYGPWGRPDMALFKFTKAILNGDPIDVYNEGNMQRDFTYIDDIVEGVVRVTDRIPDKLGTVPDLNKLPLIGDTKDSQGACPQFTPAPYRLYNIGNHSPVDLLDFIRALEDALGKKAKLNFMPMQPGDVPATYADVDDLMRDVGFAPKTPIKEGIGKFVEWYKGYYH